MTSSLSYTRLTPSGFLPDKVVTISSLVILEAAEKNGVTWEIIPGTRIIKLSYGEHSEYFRDQICSTTTDVGSYGTVDKSITKALLQAAGIATPRGYKILATDNKDVWLNFFHSLPKPLVVKPTNLNGGRNVFVNISTTDEYVSAVEKCLTVGQGEEFGVVVEEMFEGKEYRLLASNEETVAITHRVAANVVGDGVHTITELVHLKNNDSRRGQSDEPFTKPLKQIVLDEEALGLLADQQMSLTDVPKKNQQVVLKRTSNLSQGGESIDYTDIAHPSVREIGVQAINAIPGLMIGGVDFISTNIEIEQTKDTYRIIEVNNSPGIFMHEFPVEGKSRQTGYFFLKQMFPELKG